MTIVENPHAETLDGQGPSLNPAPADKAPSKRKRAGVLALRAFMRDKVAVGAALVLLGVVVVAAFAPVVAPYSPTEGDLSRRLEGIGAEGHLLGLDHQGRDILSRLIWGARYSLAVAVIPVIAVFPLALAIGLVAGYVRGVLGETLMRIMDVLFAFPMVLLAMALAAAFGAGFGNMMIAIGITLIPYLGRVAYTSTVQESSREYIEGAVVGGAKLPEILIRQLLPNVLSPLVIYSTMLCGFMIIVGGGLSFLGLGVSPPTPDWGVMTSDGSTVLLEGRAHVATVPGLAIVLVALAFNLLGDGLRDALDPRKRTL